MNSVFSTALQNEKGTPMQFIGHRLGVEDSFPAWALDISLGCPFGVVSGCLSSLSTFENEISHADVLASATARFGQCMAIPAYGVTQRWGTERSVLVVSPEAPAWSIEVGKAKKQGVAITCSGLIDLEKNEVEREFKRIEVFAVPLLGGIRYDAIKAADIISAVKGLGIDDIETFDGFTVVPDRQFESHAWVLALQ